MAVAIACLGIAMPRAAIAGPVVITGGVGAIRLEKRTPVALSATSVVGRVEAGTRLGPRTAARLRLEGFRADGINGFLALVTDLELTADAGLVGFAGVSAGTSSGVGSNVGAGGFVRRFVDASVAIRIDAYASAALRNDFGGIGIGVIVGAEWRP